MFGLFFLICNSFFFFFCLNNGDKGELSFGSVSSSFWLRWCRWWNWFFFYWTCCCYFDRFSWPNRRCRCTPVTPTGVKRSRTSASNVSNRFRPTTSWCSTSASTRVKNLIVAPIAIDVSSSSVTSSSTHDSIQVSHRFSSSSSFIIWRTREKKKINWSVDRADMGRENVRIVTSSILSPPPYDLGLQLWLSTGVFKDWTLVFVRQRERERQINNEWVHVCKAAVGLSLSLSLV